MSGASASFTYEPPTPLDGQTVSFTSTSSSTNGAISYSWDFGDGGTSTLANPTHEFAAPDHPATYEVRLQIVDSAGSVDLAVQNVTAHPANEKPIATFTVGSAKLDQPTEFDATGSYDPDGTISDYSWSWGDGSPDESGAALTNPTHTYSDVGTFTATLTVTDNGGRQDVFSQQLNVRPSEYYVNADWVGVPYGEDPDGAGPAHAIGLDAFVRIGDVMEGIQPDDTIHVAAGTYADENTIQLFAEGVKLLGAGRDVTHVTNLNRLNIEASHELVSGLDFQGQGTWDEETHVFNGPRGPSSASAAMSSSRR